MRFVKKLPILCLVTSMLSPLAFAEEQNDINGFAVLGGLTLFGGDAGDIIDAAGGEQQALTISGSYTWRSGFGLGITSTSMVNTGLNSDIGYADFYASYTFDSNLKLMAGVGVLVEETYYDTYNEEGLMLGIGYTLPVGISFELHHAFNEVNGIDGSGTSLLVGYKW